MICPIKFKFLLFFVSYDAVAITQFNFLENDAQLLASAELYEVETSVRICKSENRVADVDEITFVLLACI